MFIPMQEIATYMGCSEKTIRNDMKDISEWLKKKEMNVVRKPSVGVKIEGRKEQIDSILRDISNIKSNVTTIPDQQRLTKMAFMILTQNQPCTIQQLCGTFYVNKQVIKKDLEKIQHWLKRFQLTLHTKQKIGVTIEGNEIKWRSALARLDELKTSGSKEQFLEEWFLPHERNMIVQAFRSYNHVSNAGLSEENVRNLCIHTLIAIKRIKTKNRVVLPNVELKQIKEKKEYTDAQEIVSSLEKNFVVKFPESEVAYIAIHLLGTRQLYGENSKEFEIESNVSELVQFLIQEMSDLTGYEFEIDVDLRNGLTIHLKSAVNRLTHGLEVSNPMVQEIKKIYPYLFGLVVTALCKAKGMFSYPIPEEEAAYVCLHFQAGYERLKKKNGKHKRVLISCSMGIGVSHLLKTKLERKFHSLEIVGVVSTVDFQQMSMEKVDFVISTSPVQTSVPVFQVSPLLTDQEILRIQTFIEEKEKQWEHGETHELLQTYINKEMLLIETEIKHRFELIEQIGMYLVGKGLVSKEYIQSSIIRESLSSTAIGGGIAIPHGNPENVLKSSVGILYLKRPIDWEGQQVSLLFLLALKKEDTKTLRFLYQEIDRLSEQPFLMEQLAQLATKEEIIHALLASSN